MPNTNQNQAASSSSTTSQTADVCYPVYPVNVTNMIPVKHKGITLYADTQDSADRVLLALKEGVQNKWYNPASLDIMFYVRHAIAAGKLTIIAYDAHWIQGPSEGSRYRGRCYVPQDGSGHQIYLASNRPAKKLTGTLLHKSTHSALPLALPVLTEQSPADRYHMRKLRGGLCTDYWIYNNKRSKGLLTAEEEKIASLIFKKPKARPKLEQMAEHLAHTVQALSISEEACRSIAPNFTQALDEYVQYEIENKIKAGLLPAPAQTSKPASSEPVKTHLEENWQQPEWQNAVLKGIEVDYSKSDLAGSTVYHGTLASDLDSIKQGPRNIGRGLGGAGLYVDFDPNVAEKFACIKGEFKLDNPGIALEGRLHPDKLYRIARIQLVQRGHFSKIDYTKGHFPADWAKNPELQALIHKHFDILEVCSEANVGYDVPSNRFFVIHEGAGKDVISWTREYPVYNSLDKPLKVGQTPVSSTPGIIPNPQASVPVPPELPATHHNPDTLPHSNPGKSALPPVPPENPPGNPKAPSTRRALPPAATHRKVIYPDEILLPNQPMPKGGNGPKITVNMEEVLKVIAKEQAKNLRSAWNFIKMLGPTALQRVLIGVGIGISMDNAYQYYDFIEDTYTRMGVAGLIGIMDFAAHGLVWTPFILEAPQIAIPAAILAGLSAVIPHHPIIEGKPTIEELRLAVEFDVDMTNGAALLAAGDWIRDNIDRPISEWVYGLGPRPKNKAIEEPDVNTDKPAADDSKASRETMKALDNLQGLASDSQKVNPAAGFSVKRDIISDTLFKPVLPSYESDGKKTKYIDIGTQPDFLPRFDHKLGKSSHASSITLPDCFGSLQYYLDNKQSLTFNSNFFNKNDDSATQYKFNPSKPWWRELPVPDGKKTTPVPTSFSSQSPDKPRKDQLTFNVFPDGTPVIQYNSVFGAPSHHNTQGKTTGKSSGTLIDPQAIFENGAGAVATQFINYFGTMPQRIESEKYGEIVGKQIRAIFPAEIFKEFNEVFALINVWKAEPYDPKTDPYLKHKNMDDPYVKQYIEKKRAEDPVLGKAEKNALLGVIRFRFNNFWHKLSSEDLPSLRAQLHIYLYHKRDKYWNPIKIDAHGHKHRVKPETKAFILNTLLPALERMEQLLPNVDAFLHYFENGIRLENLDERYNALSAAYSQKKISRSQFETEKSAIEKEYKAILGEVNAYLEKNKKGADKNERKNIDNLIRSNKKSSNWINNNATQTIANREYTEYLGANELCGKQRNTYFEAVKGDRQAQCELVKMAKAPELANFALVEENQYIITQDEIWFFDAEKKSLTRLTFLEGKTPDALIAAINLSGDKRWATEQDYNLIASSTGHTPEGILSSEELLANFAQYSAAWAAERANLESLLLLTPEDKKKDRKSLQDAINTGDNQFKVDTAHFELVKAGRTVLEKRTDYDKALSDHKKDLITDAELDASFKALEQASQTDLDCQETLFSLTPKTDTETASSLQKMIANTKNRMGCDAAYHELAKVEPQINKNRQSFIEAYQETLKGDLSEEQRIEAEKKLKEAYNAYVASLGEKKSCLANLLPWLGDAADQNIKKDTLLQINNIQSIMSNTTGTTIDIKTLYASVLHDTLNNTYLDALTRHLKGDLDEEAFIAVCSTLSEDCQKELAPLITGIAANPECTAEIKGFLTGISKNTAFNDRARQQLILTLLGKAHPGMNDEAMQELFAKVDAHLQQIVDSDRYSQSLTAKARIAMYVEAFAIAKESAEALVAKNPKDHPGFLLLIDAHIGLGTENETILSLLSERDQAFPDEKDQAINQFYRAKVLGDENALRESFANLKKLEGDARYLPCRQQNLDELDQVLAGEHRDAKKFVASRDVISLLPIQERAAYFDDLVRAIEALKNKLVVEETSGLEPSLNDGGTGEEQNPGPASSPATDETISGDAADKTLSEVIKAESDAEAQRVKSQNDQELLEDLERKLEIEAIKLAEDANCADINNLQNLLENLSRVHLIADVGLLLFKDNIQKWAEKKYDLTEKQSLEVYNRINQVVGKGAHFVKALVNDNIQSAIDPERHLRENTSMSEGGLEAFGSCLKNKPAPGMVQTAHDFLGRYNTPVAAVQLATVLTECLVDRLEFLSENGDMPDEMKAWFKPNALKHFISVASPTVHFAAEGFNLAQTTLGTYLFWTNPNNNALALARQAATAPLNLPWIRNMMHRIDIQADGSLSESYTWNFAKLFVEHMAGSVWQQLYFTHEDTIIKSVIAPLLKTPLASIGALMAEYHRGIVGGTFALRTLSALKKTVEGTAEQVVEARRFNLKDRFYKIANWVATASKDQSLIGASRLYAELKKDTEYTDDLHPDITKLYVSTLFFQHLNAGTLEVVPLQCDGNSLFKAVSVYTDESADVLRQKAVAHILSNKDVFKPRIEVPTGKTADEAFTAWTQNMSKSGVPGDAVVIDALSSLLGRPIILLSEGLKPDFDKEGLIKLPDTSLRGKPIFIACQTVPTKRTFYHAVHLQGELYFEKQYIKNKKNSARPAHLLSTVAHEKFPLHLSNMPGLTKYLAQSKQRVESITQPKLPAQSMFAQKPTSENNARQKRAASTARYREMLLRKKGKSGEQKPPVQTSDTASLEQESGSIVKLPVLPSVLGISEDAKKELQASRTRFFQRIGKSETFTWTLYNPPADEGKLQK
ncbi:OTU-like cysteine protease [Legionella geestiana]|uniref:OTU-like cysteine protease n=1 Tax=Legionella geestiana TaxID=45065 RepID=A0A0W0U7L2_9GAMM|nr:hypothetical protein [Legionella geestiana]KTD04014.1 OTU-like cysteine protease [Legionella geestiana]QBS12872.1 hypothetical protein E4T54_08995 [Legionella geestiana]STX54641.1 Predicted cysteine protease (OTU family) [Legionella geestiana]